jgi:hypothetical protein
MISTNSIIYSFIISTIYKKDYDTNEYIKIFLIVLLSSIFTFYIKNLINPLINSFINTNKNQSGGSFNSINKQSTPSLNFNSTIPNIIPQNINLNPNNMAFNMNKPMF